MTSEASFQPANAVWQHLARLRNTCGLPFTLAAGSTVKTCAETGKAVVDRYAYCRPANCTYEGVELP